MTDFETTIGLEIHAQLRCRTKIFCPCPTGSAEEPNRNICPVCAGLPGAMPSLNEEAVALGLRTALALHCDVQTRSSFARKHYFYPDLPKGYQITQHREPLASQGFVEIETASGPREIGLERLHLEEDAGKSRHLGLHSHVDLNRAGTPLVEIVSTPELKTPDEAVAFAKGLREILVYLEVCDGNMETGSLRIDANISTRPVGETTLGRRVELKNINSFSFLRAALKAEENRQRQRLRDGENVLSETRGWDEERKVSVPMRRKETLEDYRYFPEPDLAPLVIDSAQIESQLGALPELPAQKRTRLQVALGLSAEHAQALTAAPSIAAYFESIEKQVGDARVAARFVCGHVLYRSAGSAKGFEPPMPPSRLAELLNLLDGGTISHSAAKTVFDEMLVSREAPSQIVTRLDLALITDENLLRRLSLEVLEKYPEQRVEYQGGKKQVFGFFIGQAMSLAGGAADPAQLNRIMRTLLDDKN